ncbi:MAG: CRISPR-associated helicase Cas3', partial [Puniceicoccaceae bacterium]
MTPQTFTNLFQTATGHQPYLWQCRLACGEPPPKANGDLNKPDEPTSRWLTTAHPCASRLIDIPTGLGKTAGVTLAWLWNFLIFQNGRSKKDAGNIHAWPRRLVYCLPMRTLVEQTEGEVKNWLNKVAQAASLSPDFEKNRQAACSTFTRPRVVVLMGGEDVDPASKDWDLYLEEPAILIGTQDMLLSRALNRGYGMSRYRWPMHFALLNNDALWVIDEVQLMGPGLAATTQLEGFRNAFKELGSRGCHSWWMSATIRPDWLKTVDMPDNMLAAAPLRLSNTEMRDGGRVEALRTASKVIDKSATDSGAKHLQAVAKFIEQNRSSDGLNLVVVNTVKRARELFSELKRLLKGDADVLLLHSQFRPDDRQRVLGEIKKDEDKAGKIVVSTQVIEAGVDLSAQTLFTELAPWSSLVQRFGRCNRWLIDGQHHYPKTHIYWFDLPEEKDHLPYATNTLNAGRERLQGLNNAGIQHLEGIVSPDADRPQFRHVIRRKDLVDLFDTTPDLAGADLDIDRFIRDADDSHVQVFWRHWLNRTPNGAADSSEPETAPQRSELCTVSIGDFRDFVKKQGPAYRWNALDREWQTVSANDVHPGQVYLLHTSQGGYDDGSENTLPTGWNGDPKAKVAQAASLSS